MAGFHDFTNLARDLEQLARSGATEALIAAKLTDIESVASRLVVPTHSCVHPEIRDLSGTAATFAEDRQSRR